MKENSLKVQVLHTLLPWETPKLGSLTVSPLNLILLRDLNKSHLSLNTVTRRVDVPDTSDNFNPEPKEVVVYPC